jgi:hypothetical protein
VAPMARKAWPRWWPAGLAWALWALTLLGLGVTVWLDQLLRQAGRPDMVQWTAEDATYAVLAFVSAATVGAVVVRFRRARGVERQQLRWVALAAALVTPRWCCCWVGSWAAAPTWRWPGRPWRWRRGGMASSGGRGQRPRTSGGAAEGGGNPRRPLPPRCGAHRLWS